MLEPILGFVVVLLAINSLFMSLLTISKFILWMVLIISSLSDDASTFIKKILKLSGLIIFVSWLTFFDQI